MSKSSSSSDLERALSYYEKSGADADVLNKEERTAESLIKSLITDGDRNVRADTSSSRERALEQYAKAADVGSEEAAIRHEVLLQKLHTVVVINLPVIDDYLVDNLQRDLPSYVQVIVNNDERIPLNRLRADIAIVDPAQRSIDRPSINRNNVVYTLEV